MADAAGAAPREVFSYAYAGAHADAAATFAARGSMELFFSTDVDGAEMDNLLPADFPIKRCGGGLSSIAYGDFAKALMAAHRGRQREYPGYMQAALAARAAATEAQRAALTLNVADLEATEGAPPAAAGAEDPEDTRGFLMQLTYGSLGSQHGQLALARLTHGLGCHAGHVFRRTTGFRRGMHCLSQAAAVVTGLAVADMEPQEVAEAVSSELRAIAWGTEFEHLGAELGEMKWTQLRKELDLGRPAEWSKAATRARLLAERFHGVTGGPRFTAVAAVVRGREPATSRSLTSPEACALAEEVAVRILMLVVE
ncbi:hypothetical protein AB1Y20_017178 [Prymnesium parvum]|uniref:Uncharacterized protein n=1 Tax=Prymnesium parvum TaxID=97485 RepID=A0AB34IBY5_PRYPA